MSILNSIGFATVLTVAIGLFFGLVDAISHHFSKRSASRRHKELRDRLMYLEFLRGAQRRFFVVASEIRGVGGPSH